MRGRTEVAREPLGQSAFVEIPGVEHVHESEIFHTLSPNPLFRLRFHPWYNQRVLLERERLAHRVVAAHGNDPVGTLHERCRVVHKVEDLESRASLGPTAA